MKRTTMILWLIAAGVTAIALFNVKQQVKAVERELAAVEGRILDHQEAIHVLDAEWAYRTRPTRIARLASEYLQLAPLPPENVIGIGRLPWRGDDAPVEPALPPDPAVQSFLASAETGR